jgi:hypothetical protein
VYIIKYMCVGKYTLDERNNQTFHQGKLEYLNNNKYEMEIFT